GRYNLIYGSIAVVIVFVLWAWIVALITLFGGELTGHIQAMMLTGHSAETVERQHQERAHPHRQE
nr:YihY/virulence factor BrkB family protein [Chloroflexota bacterium]